VCNDGVTIAKEFDLKDPEENLGAQMLRQAAEKTGEIVGDAADRTIARPIGRSAATSMRQQQRETRYR